MYLLLMTTMTTSQTIVLASTTLKPAKSCRRRLSIDRSIAAHMSMKQTGLRRNNDAIIIIIIILINGRGKSAFRSR